MSEEGPKKEAVEIGPIQSQEDARNRLAALVHELRGLVRGKRDAENAVYSPTTSEEMRAMFRAEIVSLEEEIEALYVRMEKIAGDWDVEFPEEDF